MSTRLPGAPPPWRTALSVVLAAGLALTLALCLVLAWARGTVLDAGWMKGTLREVDAWALLRQEGIPAWLDARMIEFGVEEHEQRAFAVQVLLEVMSTEELRDRGEHVLDEALPYLAADADSMSVRPRLHEWVLEVPETLARLDFPTWTVDAVLAPKLRPAVETLAAAPLEVPVAPEEARELAREIVPAEWIDPQVVGATYAVARWAVGKQRTFEIRIDYAERVDAATEAFKRLLRRSHVEDVLIDRVVVPMAEQGLVDLPGLEGGIDRALLEETIREAAPEGWLAREVDGLIDALGEWLNGHSVRFAYTVETGHLADTAGAIARGLARRAVGDGAAEPLVEELLGRVRQYFPQRQTWGEAELRAGVGEEAWQELLRLRGLIRDGFRYDQGDLRRDLRQQLRLRDAQIDGLRHVLGVSYVYTELDLALGGLGTGTEARLLGVRSATGWRWAAWVGAAVLLLGLAWASGPGPLRRALFVSATVAATGLLLWAGAAPWVAAVMRDSAMGILPGSERLPDHPTLLALLGRLDGAAGTLAWWGRALFALGALGWAALAVARVRARARARS